MLHKLIKRCFDIVINIIQAIRVTMVFLCFFMITYWFLHLAGAVFAPGVETFFGNIANFVHLFYNRIVQIDGVNVDFSYLVLTVFLLAIVYGLTYAVRNIVAIEKSYDKAHEVVRQQKENLFNVTLEQEVVLSEYKNNKVLIAVKFAVANLTKDKFYTKNFNEGSEDKLQAVQEDFLELLEGNLKSDEEVVSKGVIFIKLVVKNVDSKLEQFELLINALKAKYKEQGWQVDYFASIDVYSNLDEVEVKFKNLARLTHLGNANKILCLSTFKKRYLLNQGKKYNFVDVGLYKIADNEEVFILERLT